MLLPLWSVCLWEISNLHSDLGYLPDKVVLTWNEPSASQNPDNHALEIKGLSFKGFLTQLVFFVLFNQSISLYKLWILGPPPFLPSLG